MSSGRAAGNRGMVSSAEYAKLEEETRERFEYLNGEVFAMSGETFPHNQIIARLMQRLGGGAPEEGLRDARL